MWRCAVYTIYLLSFWHKPYFTVLPHYLGLLEHEYIIESLLSTILVSREFVLSWAFKNFGWIVSRNRLKISFLRMPLIEFYFVVSSRSSKEFCRGTLSKTADTNFQPKCYSIIFLLFNAIQNILPFLSWYKVSTYSSVSQMNKECGRITFPWKHDINWFLNI